MAKKQYSGVRESKPGRINDLGTTGKEVEEQFRKGCLKKADRTFAQGLQCQQINSMAALMSLEDSVFIRSPSRVCWLFDHGSGYVPCRSGAPRH